MFSRTCGCGLEHLVRIPRRPWMRVLPRLAFYRCSICGKEQLASEKEVDAAVLPHVREKFQQAWIHSEKAPISDK
ncbi:MAG: hypothetical protein V4636_12810 [Pseudomonadota bacterium]